MINEKFAEKFSDRWVILSPKYGFINPDFLIQEDYNVAFKKRSTNPIGLDALRRQVTEKRLGVYDVVIALGGRDYTDIVKQVFQDSPQVVALTEKLPQNKAVARVKSLFVYDKNDLSKVLIGIL